MDMYTTVVEATQVVTDNDKNVMSLTTRVASIVVK